MKIYELINVDEQITFMDFGGHCLDKKIPWLFCWGHASFQLGMPYNLLISERTFF